MNLDTNELPAFFLEPNYYDEVIVPSDELFNYAEGWIEPFQAKAQEIYEAYMKLHKIEIPNEADLIAMDTEVFEAYCIGPDTELTGDYDEHGEFKPDRIDFCTK